MDVIGVGDLITYRFTANFLGLPTEFSGSGVVLERRQDPDMGFTFLIENQLGDSIRVLPSEIQLLRRRDT